MLVGEKGLEIERLNTALIGQKKDLKWERIVV